jgi:predicted proteasome-type protease
MLDRLITYDASLAEAEKCALPSLGASRRGNLSVAPPIQGATGIE